MPPSPDDIREHRENIDQAHAEEVRDAWMKAATEPREWPWPGSDLADVTAYVSTFIADFKRGKC